METQEDTSGAAGQEPAAPNHNQEDSASEAMSPDALQAKVQELEERAERLLANWQRAQADLANYRKQVEREQQELLQLAATGLMADTLPILDDLERAFGSIPANLRSLTWIDGVWLVYKKMEAILSARGMEVVEAEAAQAFDPNLHQALSEVEGEAGKIVEVVQKGYTIGGRLLRPALVTIGKGSASTEEEKGVEGETAAEEGAGEIPSPDESSAEA